MSTIFELWVAWSSHIYGGEAQRTSQELLALIWHRAITQVRTQVRKPAKFKNKQWIAAGWVEEDGVTWAYAQMWGKKKRSAVEDHI